jgi:prepilin peptidase CpaA
LHPILWLSLVALTGTAAVYDLRERRIPNWLVATGFAAGLVAQTSLRGWSGFAAAVFGCGVALLLYLPLFALRAIGGGDVKLMAAVGSLAGPQNWLLIFLLASVTGGVLALLLILSRKTTGRAVVNTLHIFAEAARLRLPYQSRPELDIAHPRALSVPHGVAIAEGTFLFLMFGRS